MYWIVQLMAVIIGIEIILVSWFKRGGDVMFNKKKTLRPRSYDAATKRPVMKSSICTGERVAGFVDKESGRFEDIMLIRGEADLQEFCGLYGLKAQDIGKIW